MWVGYNQKFDNFSCGFAFGVDPNDNRLMVSLFPNLDSGNLKFWSEVSIIQGGDFYSFVEAKYSPKEWMIYPGIDFETKLGKFFLVGPSATFVLGKYIKTKIGIYFKSFSPDDDGVKMNPVFIEKPHHHRPLLKKDIPMPWKKTMALRAYIIIAL